MEPEDQIKNRVDRDVKARKRCRELANVNFRANVDKFVSFTYADNVQDVEKAQRDYKTFIQRMRYFYGDFLYLSVIENQKRGAIHFHSLMTVPYIPKERLREIWANGEECCWVKINRIKKVDNLGAYITKYMTKDIGEERFMKKHRYLRSKGLEEPIILRGNLAEEYVKMMKLDQKKAVLSRSYASEYQGETVYNQYNLIRG